MAEAKTTTATYLKGDMSARKLHALLLEHNQGVRDDHAICAKLDADETVADSDYEAKLTALEVSLLLDEAEEEATPTTHDSRHLSEALLTDLVEQMNARVADIRTIAAKLNADAAVVGDDYASTAATVAALGNEGEGQLYGGAGSGVSGAVIQALTDTHAALTRDWHAIAAKLDADAGATDTDYEDQLKARVLTEV